MSRLRLRSLVQVLLLLAFEGFLFAQSVPVQVDANNSTGIVPYSTYSGVRENINLENGNVSINIPLLHVPGRNGLDLDLALNFDTKRWNLQDIIDPGTGADMYYWDQDETSSIGLNYAYLISSWYGIYPTHPDDYMCQGIFIFQSPDGGKHPFRTARTDCWWYSRYGPVRKTNLDVPQDESNDSSFYHLDLSNPSEFIVTDKHGTKYHFPGNLDKVPATSVEDSNGNHIDFTPTTVNGVQHVYITDTGGRLYDVLPQGSGTQISFKDSDGAPRTVSWTTVTGTQTLPTFTLPASGALGVQCCYGGTVTVTLPNSQAYTVEFNNYNEVTKVTYPTGGYTRYDYQAFVAFHPFWGPTPATSTAADFREVVAKHVCRDPDGNCSPTSEQTTTYTPTVNSSMTSNQYMDEFDPMGNKTRYQFSFAATTDKWYSPRELTRWVYDGSSTLLRTIQTEYNYLVNGTTSASSQPVRQTTTANDASPAQVSKVEWDYDGSNIIEERTYDWGSGAPGNLLRRVANTWLKTNPINSIDYTQNSIHILDRKASEKIYDSNPNPVAQTQYEYDNFTEGLGSSGATHLNPCTVRGNLTVIQRWRDTDSLWLPTRNQYDDAGNITKVTDPLGHWVQYIYADSWANTTCAPASGQNRSYVTTINKLNQTQHFTYFSCSGLNASIQDVNGNFSYFSYDVLGRRNQITLPQTTDDPCSQFAQGQTNISFSDSTRPVAVQFTVTKNSCSASGGNQVSTALMFDGIGLLKQTQLTTDPDGITYNDVDYDGNERKSQVSNPYRGVNPGLSTLYSHDGLGRLKVTTLPDGNTIQTAYSGNATTVTDETLRQRRSVSDALGRLTSVVEPNETTGALSYTTTYGYNALGNLLSVVQNGSRPRSFVYDSLGELTQATNPESGVITYTYNNDGLLTTKTSPRPNQTQPNTTVTITYGYDGLHRIVSKSDNWNNSSSSSFTYDVSSLWGQTIANPIGRLVAAYGPGGSSLQSYDAMGRVSNRWSCNSQNCSTAQYGTSYGYDLAGYLTSLTLPLSGTRKLTQIVGGAGRPLSLTSSWTDEHHPANLVTAATYDPSGALSSMLYGNGLKETRDYNPRLQPNQIRLYEPNTQTDVLSLTYTWTDPNNANKNNGNLITWSASGAQAFNRAYTYDKMNRISTMADPGGNLCWTYDPWGNRLQQTSSLTCNQVGTNVNANNQLLGYGYDAAGNLITIPAPGAMSLTYDAENRLVTVAGGPTYSYDASGARIKKVNGTAQTIDVLDASGKLAARFDETAQVISAFAYFGGRLVAEYTNTDTKFIHVDHLGSTRLVTALDKSVVESNDYLPFGESSQAGGIPLKFTGKERDSETGLDYFGARYYGSNMGRFMTPDPVSIMKQKVVDPQQWNMYSYTRNNPLRFTDPTGKYVCSGGKDECARIKSALDAAQKAADNLKKGSSDRIAIEKSLNFYGKEGEKNGVTVKFGDLSKEGAAADAQTRSLFGLFKSTTVTFDLKAMDRGSGVADDAGVAVHEGTHGADEREGTPTTGSRAAYFGAEYRAWRAGTAVGRGLDTLQTVGGVWRGGGDENNLDVEDRIMKNAQFNATADCNINGDCK